jgi:hypothetical protein
MIGMTAIATVSYRNHIHLAPGRRGAISVNIILAGLAITT